MQTVELAPSILAADFTRLGDQVRAALDAGAAYIHVDVMDGHFVPNLSIGVPVVRALRPIVPQGVVLDVHLMIEAPEKLIPAFAQAGADNLTVHVETCPDLPGTLAQIHSLGCTAGVTLNPPTPLDSLEDALPHADLALLMSVDPGFGGQAYIPSSTEKIARLRAMLDAIGSDAPLAVDGGVHPANAREVVGAGATVLVVGSGIFNDRATVAENMDALRAAVA